MSRERSKVSLAHVALGVVCLEDDNVVPVMWYEATLSRISCIIFIALYVFC